MGSAHSQVGEGRPRARRPGQVPAQTRGRSPARRGERVRSWVPTGGWGRDEGSPGRVEPAAGPGAWLTLALERAGCAGTDRGRERGRFRVSG